MQAYRDERYPLYDPAFEHDACGIGAVISIRGEQTHRTVDDALKIVEKLQHRAGKDACGETGDGVGLMMQIPHRLMVKAAAECGMEELGAARSYGVGMFFFPQDTLTRLQAKKMLEIIVRRHGVEFLGWREVPVCPEVLGGLPVPRPSAEIVNGTVMNVAGENVDAAFRLGAEKGLELAKREKPDLIVLQSRSPSCGVKQIYDGTFSGRKIPGQGLFAAAAAKAGFRVIDIEDIDSLTL